MQALSALMERCSATRTTGISISFIFMCLLNADYKELCILLHMRIYCYLLHSWRYYVVFRRSDWGIRCCMTVEMVLWRRIFVYAIGPLTFAML